ncbi:NAD(P)-dependent oxidoreductase [Catenuloplanes niger JCM 9533]
MLVTGAAGTIGTLLRRAWAGTHVLHCHDVAAPTVTLPGETWSRGDVTALTVPPGVDVVVHLAANARPGVAWEELRHPNVDGTRHVFAASVAAGVRTVVFASSHHAGGGYDRDRTPGVSARWPVRPCCFYGVTKTLGESFGRYHADRDGLTVTCLRLGDVDVRPHDELALRIWLSHPDLVRAFDAALTRAPGFGTFLVSSRNSRSRWDVTEDNRLLGYAPRDDAEDYTDLVGDAVSQQDCFRGPVANPHAPGR